VSRDCASARPAQWWPAALHLPRGSERDLAEELLPGLGPGMLVLADRGFYSYLLWHKAAATHADLLWRVYATLSLPLVKALQDRSFNCTTAETDAPPSEDLRLASDSLPKGS
jgi:hypothetical protein